MTDIVDKSALEIHKAFMNKEISAVEITKAFLNRIKKYDTELNSFITVTDKIALDQAEALDKKLENGEKLGKLAGVPIAIKDLVNFERVETTAASKILKGHVSKFNATIAQKFLDADAILLGKLNLDEFAMGSSNEHSAYGNVKNPWNPKHVPGGSSGGSAASVSAKLTALAYGTDTGGSIRQPAAYTGIVGMKPTYGRVSRFGVIAFASSLDQAGPMTRTVKDNAMLLEVMAGYDPKDSTSINEPVPNYLQEIENGFEKTKNLNGLRIGIPEEFFVEGLHPEVKEAVEKAIEHYKSLGAEIVKVNLPMLKYGLPAYYIIAPSEASSNLSRYDGVRFGHRDKEADNLMDLYLNSRAAFGSEVKRRIMLGVYALSSGYYDAYYKKAQQVRRLIAEDFKNVFEKCDLILTPTVPNTAFEIGSKTEDPLSMYLEDVLTVTLNLAGLPGMSLNCGFDSKGLPIGMQLIAPTLEESRIFNAAYAYESTTDFNKSPDLDKTISLVAG